MIIFNQILYMNISILCFIIVYMFYINKSFFVFFDFIWTIVVDIIFIRYLLSRHCFSNRIAILRHAADVRDWLGLCFFRSSTYFIHSVCILRCSIRMRVFIFTLRIYAHTYIGYLNPKVFEPYFSFCTPITDLFYWCNTFFYIRSI